MNAWRRWRRRSAAIPPGAASPRKTAAARMGSLPAMVSAGMRGSLPRRAMLRGMDQPHRTPPSGTEPIRTICRDELKAKLDRGDDFKLIMALNRWAFDAKHIPGSLHFDTPEELYAAVQPGRRGRRLLLARRLPVERRAVSRSRPARLSRTSAATRAGCSTGRTPACRSRASSSSAPMSDAGSIADADAPTPPPTIRIAPRSRPSGAAGTSSPTSSGR